MFGLLGILLMSVLLAACKEEDDGLYNNSSGGGSSQDDTPHTVYESTGTWSLVLEDEDLPPYSVDQEQLRKKWGNAFEVVPVRLYAYKNVLYGQVMDRVLYVQMLPLMEICRVASWMWDYQHSLLPLWTNELYTYHNYTYEMSMGLMEIGISNFNTVYDVRQPLHYEIYCRDVNVQDEMYEVSVRFGDKTQLLESKSNKTLDLYLPIQSIELNSGSRLDIGGKATLVMHVNL